MTPVSRMELADHLRQRMEAERLLREIGPGIVSGVLPDVEQLRRGCRMRFCLFATVDIDASDDVDGQVADWLLATIDRLADAVAATMGGGRL